MREPDLTGHAKAWHIDTTEQEKRHKESWGYKSSSLDTWIVSGPYHPFWSWWQISVIHLRDMEGAPPANKIYPEAEYEFTIWSLNAGVQCDRKTVDIDDIEDGKEKAFPGFLHPADVTFQFDGVTDDQAIEICKSAVEAIVSGVSCDSDFRQWWLDSLAKTVEHYTIGH